MNEFFISKVVQCDFKCLDFQKIKWTIVKHYCLKKHYQYYYIIDIIEQYFIDLK